MGTSEQSRFEDLLRRYLQPLRRLAWSYARDQAECDDLLQEIALALWTALPNFRGDSTERTWLYRIAHNTSISHLASSKRRGAREANEPGPEPASAGDDPEAEVIYREKQMRLWSAIRELSLPDRQVIVLYLEGMSAAEIEAVTGFSAGSIATRLTRIRQKLAARVAGEERAHER
ncbi:MAG: sigma-70 family RNA polymerase sigma factor [Bryobacteraceae bacterium]